MDFPIVMLVYQRVCAGGLYHIVSTGIWPANLLAMRWLWIIKIFLKWMHDKDRHSQTIFCWAVSEICTTCFFGGHAKAPKLEVERLVAVAPTGSP